MSRSPSALLFVRHPQPRRHHAVVRIAHPDRDIALEHSRDRSGCTTSLARARRSTSTPRRGGRGRQQPRGASGPLATIPRSSPCGARRLTRSATTTPIKTVVSSPLLRQGWRDEAGRVLADGRGQCIRSLATRPPPRSSRAAQSTTPKVKKTLIQQNSDGGGIRAPRKWRGSVA